MARSTQNQNDSRKGAKAPPPRNQQPSNRNQLNRNQQPSNRNQQPWNQNQQSSRNQQALGGGPHFGAGPQKRVETLEFDAEEGDEGEDEGEGEGEDDGLEMKLYV